MCTPDLQAKDKSSVQAQIQMYQGIIGRMANNSASCKTWAITIIAAMLVLIADDKIGSSSMWICYVPVILFLFLDSYYLALEKIFRDKQDSFLSKVNSDEDYYSEIFSVGNMPTKKQQFCKIKESVKSLSIFPFYGLIIAFITALWLC